MKDEMQMTPGPAASIDEQFLTITSPVDGKTVGRVVDMSPIEVGLTAARLRAAQPEWRDMGVDGRARWLGMLRDWTLDHHTELAELLIGESGKVRNDAGLEPPLVADLINFFIKTGPSALSETRPRPHGLLAAAKKLSVTQHPYPLVGVISPWNFPLVLPMMDAAPALVAGAAVLLKPSEVTPLALSRLAEGWREIGAPDVFACVTGGSLTGSAVVDAVDYIQFTGSTNTGRRIAVRAAERLIPCGLELGGKDPMIVLADADLERAANGAAWGGLFNAGQACVSVERIYVEAPVHDDFVRLLAKKVSSLRSGGEQQAEIGPMATPAQLAIVERHVEDAVGSGARVVAGGKATGQGLQFEPTVLVDVEQSMACMREETFGPTLPVMKVADAEEAIRLANDSPYGLSATVWTRDVDRGRAIAERLEVGAVNINDVIANLMSFTLPHGGWKSSGIGARLGGEAAIRKYCHAQAITTPRVSPKNELTWFPYSKARSGLIARAMRAAVGRDLRRRLGRQPRITG